MTNPKEDKQNDVVDIRMAFEAIQAGTFYDDYDEASRMTGILRRAVEQLEALTNTTPPADNGLAVQFRQIIDNAQDGVVLFPVKVAQKLCDALGQPQQIAENADGLAGGCKLLHELVAAQIEEDGAHSSFIIRSGLLYKILSHLQAAPSGEKL